MKQDCVPCRLFFLFSCALPVAVLNVRKFFDSWKKLIYWMRWQTMNKKKTFKYISLIKPIYLPLQWKYEKKMCERVSSSIYANARAHAIYFGPYHRIHYFGGICRTSSHAHVHKRHIIRPATHSSPVPSIYEHSKAGFKKSMQIK